MMSVSVYRVAYVIYEDAESMSKAFDELAAQAPSLGNKKLRILKYQAGLELPGGRSTVISPRLSH